MKSKYDVRDPGPPSKEAKEWMTEHVHEWVWDIRENDAWFFCKDPHCKRPMGALDIEARLNEYETLKKATERLSARAASMAADDLCAIRDAMSQQIPQFTGGIIKQLRAYADALEGK